MKTMGSFLCRSFSYIVSVTALVSLVGMGEVAHAGKGHVVCSSGGQLCRFIKETEKKYGIPEDLLKAIAHVESRFNPWVVNYAGRSRAFSNQGGLEKFCKLNKSRNMSVGLMQLHAPSHMSRIGGVSHMVCVKKQVDYAGALLKSYQRQRGTWQEALKKYHGSSRKDRNGTYMRKVYHKWTQLRNGDRAIF